MNFSTQSTKKHTYAAKLKQTLGITKHSKPPNEQARQLPQRYDLGLKAHKQTRLRSMDDQNDQVSSYKSLHRIKDKLAGMSQNQRGGTKISTKYATKKSKRVSGVERIFERLKTKKGLAKNKSHGSFVGVNKRANITKKLVKEKYEKFKPKKRYKSHEKALVTSQEQYAGSQGPKKAEGKVAAPQPGGKFLKVSRASGRKKLTTSSFINTQRTPLYKIPNKERIRSLSTQREIRHNDAEKKHAADENAGYEMLRRSLSDRRAWKTQGALNRKKSSRNRHKSQKKASEDGIGEMRGEERQGKADEGVPEIKLVKKHDSSNRLIFMIETLNQESLQRTLSKLANINSEFDAKIVTLGNSDSIDKIMKTKKLSVGETGGVGVEKGREAGEGSSDVGEAPLMTKVSSIQNLRRKTTTQFDAQKSLNKEKVLSNSSKRKLRIKPINSKSSRKRIKNLIKRVDPRYKREPKTNNSFQIQPVKDEKEEKSGKEFTTKVQETRNLTSTTKKKRVKSSDQLMKRTKYKGSLASITKAGHKKYESDVSKIKYKAISYFNKYRTMKEQSTPSGASSRTLNKLKKKGAQSLVHSSTKLGVGKSGREDTQKSKSKRYGMLEYKKGSKKQTKQAQSFFRDAISFKTNSKSQDQRSSDVDVASQFQVEEALPRIVDQFEKDRRRQVSYNRKREEIGGGVREEWIPVNNSPIKTEIHIKTLEKSKKSSEPTIERIDVNADGPTNIVFEYDKHNTKLVVVKPMTRSSGRARASTPGVHISNQTSSSSAKHIKPSSSTRIKIANNPAEKSQKSAKKEAEGLSVYQNRQQSRGEDLLDRKKSSVCSNHNEGSVLDQAGSNEVDLVMGFYNNQAQQGGVLKESSSSVTTNNVASQMIEAILTDHNSPDRNPIRDSKELHKTENSSSEVVAGNVGEDLEDHQKYQNDLIDIEPICDDESELTVISTLKTPITKSNNGGPLGTGVEPRGGSRQESLLFKRAENQGSAIATPQPKNSSLTQTDGGNSGHNEYRTVYDADLSTEIQRTPSLRINSVPQKAPNPIKSEYSALTQGKVIFVNEDESIDLKSSQMMRQQQQTDPMASTVAANRYSIPTPLPLIKEQSLNYESDQQTSSNSMRGAQTIDQFIQKVVEEKEFRAESESISPELTEQKVYSSLNSQQTLKIEGSKVEILHHNVYDPENTKNMRKMSNSQNLNIFGLSSQGLMDEVEVNQMVASMTTNTHHGSEDPKNEFSASRFENQSDSKDQLSSLKPSDMDDLNSPLKSQEGEEYEEEASKGPKNPENSNREKSAGDTEINQKGDGRLSVNPLVDTKKGIDTSFIKNQILGDEDVKQKYLNKLKKGVAYNTEAKNRLIDLLKKNLGPENKPTGKNPILYYFTKLGKGLSKNDSQDPFYLHFTHNIQSLQYISTLQPLEEDEFIEKKVYLPPKRNPEIKTLILDLDETLVHCDEDLSLPCDFKLPIKFTGGEIVHCGVSIRPFAKEFLKKMSQHFEIVIFTASHACYANIILNLLDPENRYITFRMFRDNCIETEEGIFIKDLRVFANRKISEIVLVDNAFYSFGFQIDNGIPILPFFRDKEDSELMDLSDFLLTIKSEGDLRSPLMDYFRGDLYLRYMGKQDMLKLVLLKHIESLEEFVNESQNQ